MLPRFCSPTSPRGGFFLARSFLGDVLPLLLTRAGYEIVGVEEVACDATILLVVMLLVDGPTLGASLGSSLLPMDGRFDDKLFATSSSSLFLSRTEPLLAVEWLVGRE